MPLARIVVLLRSWVHGAGRGYVWSRGCSCPTLRTWRADPTPVGRARGRYVAAWRPPTTILPAMTLMEAMAIARRRSAAVLAIILPLAQEVVMMPKPSEESVIYI